MKWSFYYEREFPLWWQSPIDNCTSDQLLYQLEL